MKDSLYHSMDAPMAPIEKKVEGLKPAEKAFFVLDLKLGTQLILLAYIAYTGWDFYGWASWKYRDWSSQHGGSGMHDWHSCDWGGQCPDFYTGPECAADPAHTTKECIDSARHKQWSFVRDEELCESTCPGAGNTNCGVWKKVMFDDVQQETRVEWEFGMNLQHFARWLTMGVAAFTLKDLQADEHGKLQPLVRAIIILVAAEIVIELIHVISTYQSCNDPGSNQPRPCDVGHYGDTSTPAASAADPILQCEEARDLYGIQYFFGKVLINIYFVWIISSFEKSVRGAAPATPAASPAEPV